MRILINYDYRQYPFTTASYIEMALRADPRFDVFRLGERRTACADIYINIENCETIIKWPGRLSCYWEIDNHIHRGNDIAKYNAADFVFITQRHYQGEYPKDKTFWIPLAADPEKHRLYPDEQIEFEVGFLGNDSYPVRNELLNKIGKKYKLLRSQAKPGEEYSRMLSRCKILFNCAMDNDMNMRFFEAMSIGRLLISDKVMGQDEVARDGEHYISFNGWEDLDKKIEYYLNHEKEREIIAKAGADYTHEFNTYQCRLNEMIEIMQMADKP